MPRVNLRESDKWDNDFRNIVRIQMAVANIKSPAALSRKLGISPTAMYDKIKNPDQLTLKELRKLHKILHLTDEHMARFTGVKYNGATAKNVTA